MRHFSKDQPTLDAFFLLQGLPQSLVDWALADPRCKSVTYTKGQVIFDPDRFDRALGLVLSGKIDASQHIADRGLTLRLLQTGDVFGAAVLFINAPTFPTTLTALVKTRVLFFEESLIRDLLTKDPRATENYIAFLTRRVQFLNQRIHSLIAGSAEALLGAFLLNEAKSDSVITLSTSLSALSRQLGISRASLYRAFDSLEARGYIQKSGKTITIQNHNGLQTL